MKSILEKKIDVYIIAMDQNAFLKIKNENASLFSHITNNCMRGETNLIQSRFQYFWLYINKVIFWNFSGSHGGHDNLKN